MSDDLDRDVREALAAFTDAPPPGGLAAAAIRTARRQRRVQALVTGVAVVAALAAAPVAISAVSGLGGGPVSPAASGMKSLVITAYSGHWGGSQLLDPAAGEYVKLPYRRVVPSPDGTRALVQTGENSAADPVRVGVMDVSTLEVRWIEGYYGLRGAAWSPDGREILITEQGHPDNNLVGFAIVDADTFESTFVHHDDIVAPEINTDGHRYVWAPGGQEIVLTRSTGAHLESEVDLTWGLRFYERDGTLLRTVSTTGPVPREAVFSPDGAQIAIFNPYTGAPIQILDKDTAAVLRTVPVPGWGADSWGDLIGWADDDHLLVRNPSPASNLLVIDLDGQILQAVDLLDWSEELIIGSSDGLTPDAAELTFGAP